MALLNKPEMKAKLRAALEALEAAMAENIDGGGDIDFSVRRRLADLQAFIVWANAALKCDAQPTPRSKKR